LFECIERRCVAQSEADVVQAFDQTELAERVNLKARLESLAVGNSLLFERNSELIVRNCLGVVQ